MSTFKSRMSDELLQLDHKLTKLQSFINRSEFVDLDKHDRQLLRIQEEVMKQYVRVLAERLSRTS